jgi:hypothetical protein
MSRYSPDYTWCMDQGMGLFAGLNVLSKTAWYTSYSDRVTSEMNRKFLKQLHYPTGGMTPTWSSNLPSKIGKVSRSCIFEVNLIISLRNKLYITLIQLLPFTRNQSTHDSN